MIIKLQRMLISLVAILLLPLVRSSFIQIQTCDDHATAYATAVRASLPAQSPLPALTPDHVFDFRGCTDGSAIVDLYSNLTATAKDGAVCSSSGIELDGLGSYVDLDPWEFGGMLSIEVC